MHRNISEQNFPYTCFQESPCCCVRRYGKPIQIRIAGNLQAGVAGYDSALNLYKLCRMSSTVSPSRQLDSLYPGISRGGKSCISNFLPHQLVSRQSYSFETQKKFQPSACSNVTGKKKIVGSKKLGDVNSAHLLLGMKKYNKSYACSNEEGEAKTCTPDNKGTKTTESYRKVRKVGGNKKIFTNGKQSTMENQELSGKQCNIIASTAAEANVLENASRVKKVRVFNASLPERSFNKNERADSENCQLRPLYPPSGKSVVVVESATKAKIIQKYLGSMYEVLASNGHVRDLASTAKAVDPAKDFEIIWEPIPSAWNPIWSIVGALKGAANLILASDPDREGEAIAWHIIQALQHQCVLNETITVARVTFHEITESSVKCALQSPREIDLNLVNAYQTRRILDHLIGFKISPIIWRKLPSCNSAGRVQSAALALICDREMEIEQFSPREYWSVAVEFHDKSLSTLKERFTIHSHLTCLNSKRLEQLSISSQADSKAIEKQILSSNFEVMDVRSKKVLINPPSPYITSTLQQDSVNKLHFTTSYTMELAQKLYEGIKLSDEDATGLITYMRTDGLHISNGAAKDITSLITSRYGKEYASNNICKKFEVKFAQEAHGAIRPTNIRRLPSTLSGKLDDDLLKLYTLIWTRTMACQMKPATVDMIQVDIGDTEGELVFHSVGSRIGFSGYQTVYKDSESGSVQSDEEEVKNHASTFEVLNDVKVKDTLSFVNVNIRQHYTKSPPRYSEGTLIKKLEELGIGRPSTYASILKVLKDRNYVTMKHRLLHPEFRGRMLSAFLCHHFSEIFDYGFTADMERELDNVSSGVTEWKGLLKDYWSRLMRFYELAGKVSIHQVESMLESKFGHILFNSLPDGSRTCPCCAEGTLKLKISKFGSGYFIGCDQHPKCKYIAGSTLFNEDETVESDKPETSFPVRLLGYDADSNKKIFLKSGPYGFYVQIGDDKHGSTPKRTAIFEGTDIDSLTLEDAIDLLRYPISLGKHPVDGHPIILKHSKTGFLIKHRSTMCSLSKKMNPKSITLETGLKLLQSKNAKKCGRPAKSEKAASA